MNGQGFPSGWSNADCYSSFNRYELYNPNVNQYILEDQYGQSIYTPYITYITLNLGLGGLYKKLTPRQVIEGYTDSML
jgi:hypothetical protein